MTTKKAPAKKAPAKKTVAKKETVKQEKAFTWDDAEKKLSRDNFEGSYYVNHVAPLAERFKNGNRERVLLDQIEKL